MKKIPPFCQTTMYRSVYANRTWLTPYLLLLKKAINNRGISVLLTFLLLGSLAFPQEKNIRIIVESLPGSTPTEDTSIMVLRNDYK